MKRVCTPTMGTLGLLFLGVVLAAGAALAQTATDLVGTWTLVSAINEQGGDRPHTYGPHPKGILIVDANGHYALIITRADLPRVASGNRTKTTPEESRTIVSGSIAHFGTVSVVDKTLTFQIETSLFPKWDGTAQQRPFTVTDDELRYTVPSTSGGGTATVVWKRTK